MPQPTYSAAEVDALVAGLDSRLKKLEGAPPVVTPPPVDPPPTTTGRFYSAASTWNTKLALPKFSDVPGLHGGGWLNSDQYGVPVVHTDTTSPVVTVNAPASWGWPASQFHFHIPADAAGATGTDGSITIIDGTTSYDFWQFNRSGNTANPASWAKADLVNGTGWGQASPFLAAGIHATGSALLAGLIVGSELKTGFNHALAIQLRRDLASSQHVGGAIASDGGNGPIPEGARLAIPASTPITVTTTPGKMMWKAMVDYGGFVIDVADGNPSLFFQADPRSVDPADVQALLDPNWTAVELGRIATAVRLVS